MSELREILQAQIEASARSFSAGRDAGYREGFNAGIAEAEKVFARNFPGYKPTLSAPVGVKP
jgi:hypothetical protein